MPGVAGTRRNIGVGSTATLWRSLVLPALLPSLSGGTIRSLHFIAAARKDGVSGDGMTLLPRSAAVGQRNAFFSLPRGAARRLLLLFGAACAPPACTCPPAHCLHHHTPHLCAALRAHLTFTIRFFRLLRVWTYCLYLYVLHRTGTRVAACAYAWFGLAFWVRYAISVLPATSISLRQSFASRGSGTAPRSIFGGQRASSSV